MFNERIVLANRRLLSRQPSAEIAHLMELRPKLIEDEGGSVCPATSVNLIGALILESNKNENVDSFEKVGLPAPIAINTPIQILSDMRVYNFAKGVHLDTGLVAPRVVYKTPGASGLKGVGVVIEGPMAGLYTGAVDDKNLNQGMTALRIGNDTKLTFYDPPYTTDIPNPYASEESKEDSQLEKARLFRDKIGAIDRSIINNFDRLFEEATNGGKKILYASEMFFDLCEAGGIKLHRESFHLTRLDRPTS